MMETKSKSEKIIFWGFIFLVISFIGLVYYFQNQNTLLNKKSEQLLKREELVKIKEIENKNLILEKNKIIKLVPQNLQSKVDYIGVETKQNVKENIEKLASHDGFKNSIIYVQVGSNETKMYLQKQKFNTILNSKGYNTIADYEIIDNGVDNTIRYFNSQDETLAQNLRSEILKNFPNIKLTVIHITKFKVPVGQIELWIK